MEQFMSDRFGSWFMEKQEISTASKIGIDFFQLLRIVAGAPLPPDACWDGLDLEIIPCGLESARVDFFSIKYRGKENITARFWEQYMQKTLLVHLNFENQAGTISLGKLVKEEEGIKFFLTLCNN
jgi:hypothetical protein